MLQQCLILFQITVYAAHLYDAVYLYARALDEVIKEGGDVTNGKAIIEKILGTSYMSKYLAFLHQSGILI